MIGHRSLLRWRPQSLGYAAVVLGMAIGLGGVLTPGFARGADAAPQAASRDRDHGTLVLSCPVPGAIVQIDGRKVGICPLTPFPVSLGKHTIHVARLGYVAFEATVHIDAGKKLQVVADLLPFTGVVRVLSDVPDAVVSVGGKVVGKVPIEMELGPSSESIFVTAPGYEPFMQVVEAAPGQWVDVFAEMVPVLALEGLPSLVPIGPNAAAEAPTAADSAKGSNSAGATAHGEGGGAGTGDVLDLLPLLPLAPIEPSAGSGAGSAKNADGSSMDQGRVGSGSGGDQGSSQGSNQGSNQGFNQDLLTLRIKPPAHGILAGVPWYKTWWIWTIVGSAVVAGSVSAGVLLTQRTSSPHTATVPCWQPGEGRGSCVILSP